MRISFFPLLFTICHLLAMSSAVSNPVMYGFMNENFVREARALLLCDRKRDRIRRLSENNGTTMRSMLCASTCRGSVSANGKGGAEVGARVGDACDKELLNRGNSPTGKSDGECPKQRNVIKSDWTRYFALPTDVPAAENDGETLAIELEDVTFSPKKPSPAKVPNRPENCDGKDNYIAVSNNNCKIVQIESTLKPNIKTHK